MAANAGRDISVLWGSESPQPALQGIREKGVELNGEAIDITSDDDNGWRSLLSVPAQNEVNISISGVSKDGVLRADWFAGTRTQPATIRFEDGSEIAGTFYLASYSETGTYNEAVVFEAELQSSGVIAYAPGP